MTGETLQIPIFPLPEVVFFPNTLLPLHVYEPRYKQMVADVLAGDGRMGVVQLRPGWDQDYYGTPPVYKVVGVGQVVHSQKWPDGRYDILLEGKMRGVIQKEFLRDNYRVAEVKPVEDYIPVEHSQEVADWHLKLLSNLRTMIDLLPDPSHIAQPDGWWDRPTASMVADMIANLFINSSYERQCILSEPNVARRLQLVRVQLRNVLRQPLAGEPE